MKITLRLKELRKKGGAGSGNFGHSGRPGKIGGLSGGGAGGSSGGMVDDKARSMLDELLTEHPHASIDDAQDFVYRAADKLLTSGSDIPEHWFEILDELYEERHNAY